MRSVSTAAPDKNRTFIETARRAQIVAAAIDTVAELGYSQASLARIAERAGISKGVILYHFADKDDLIRELVSDLVAKAEAYMRPRIEAQSTAAGILRAYIESNLDVMRENRNHVAATVDIALNARAADGSRLFDSSILENGQVVLQRLLAHFQDAGEFRANFDPAVMALAIRAAIDGLGTRLAHDPALDVDHHARELADLFQVATQPEGGRRDEGTVL